MTMICAFGFLMAYVAEVVLGATLSTSFLNEVQEMLVLLAASIAFVAVILRSEAAEKQ